jgi:aryl-alcohol dehydrogenase-like predicted oxidoreductase
MKYKLLGRSGLRVSELCLGCGTFGTAWGTLGSDEAESHKIFNAFVEAGGNYLDTSNRYQESQSEQFLGKFIHPNRDRLVIGTKYSLVDGMSDGKDANGGGNHRKRLFSSVESSLKRLKTDYIDMLWVHIDDFTTPIDEILRGLNDIIAQGKVLYAGASNFPAWWLARANTIAEYQGWHPFIATQLEWSIVERSSEPEFIPFSQELDIGLVSWSAMAGGMVTGKYNRGNLDPNELYRLKDHVDPNQNLFWSSATKRNLAIMDEVVKISDEIGRPASQVSLRWLMQQPVVNIPVFSARTLTQAQEDLGACDFELTPEQMQKLHIASLPALNSVMPEVGAYPYPMLEYGSPALPNFYSRALLYGSMENEIINHRRKSGYKYNP